MSSDANRSFQTPRREELGLLTLGNSAGLSASALPNGTLFSIDFADQQGGVMINQVLGSPVYGGIGRLYLRVGGTGPRTAEIVGPKAAVRFGHTEGGFAGAAKRQASDTPSAFGFIRARPHGFGKCRSKIRPVRRSRQMLSFFRMSAWATAAS